MSRGVSKNHDPSSSFDEGVSVFDSSSDINSTQLAEVGETKEGSLNENNVSTEIDLNEIEGMLDLDDLDVEGIDFSEYGEEELEYESVEDHSIEEKGHTNTEYVSESTSNVVSVQQIPKEENLNISTNNIETENSNESANIETSYTSNLGEENLDYVSYETEQTNYTEDPSKTGFTDNSTALEVEEEEIQESYGEEEYYPEEEGEVTYYYEEYEDGTNVGQSELVDSEVPSSHEAENQESMYYYDSNYVDGSAVEDPNVVTNNNEARKPQTEVTYEGYEEEGFVEEYLPEEEVLDYYEDEQTNNVDPSSNQMLEIHTDEDDLHLGHNYYEEPMKKNPNLTLKMRKIDSYDFLKSPSTPTYDIKDELLYREFPNNLNPTDFGFENILTENDDDGDYEDDEELICYHGFLERTDNPSLPWTPSYSILSSKGFLYHFLIKEDGENKPEKYPDMVNLKGKKISDNKDYILVEVNFLSTPASLLYLRPMGEAVSDRWLHHFLSAGGILMSSEFPLSTTPVLSKHPPIVSKPVGMWMNEEILIWLGLNLFSSENNQPFSVYYDTCFSGMNSGSHLESSLTDDYLVKCGVKNEDHRSDILTSFQWLKMNPISPIESEFRMVLRKVRDLMDPFSGQSRVEDRILYARCLSDPDMMARTYLNSKFLVSELESFLVDGKKYSIPSSSSEDQLSFEMWEMNESQRAKNLPDMYEPLGEDEFMEIPVKLFCVDFTHGSDFGDDKNAVLAPTTSFYRPKFSNDEMGMCSPVLCIGPIYLEFTEFSLCVPRKLDSCMAFVVDNIPPIYTIKGVTFYELMRKLSRVICEWNITKKYFGVDKKKTKNKRKKIKKGWMKTPLEFIIDVLSKLEIPRYVLTSTFRFGGAYGKILSQMKVESRVPMSFSLTNDFKKHFGLKMKLKGNHVLFKHHGQLDSFITSLGTSYRDGLESEFRDDFLLLRNFDMLFWVREFQEPSGDLYCRKTCPWGDPRDLTLMGGYKTHEEFSGYVKTRVEEEEEEEEGEEEPEERDENETKEDDLEQFDAKELKNIRKHIHRNFGDLGGPKKSKKRSTSSGGGNRLSMSIRNIRRKTFLGLKRKMSVGNAVISKIDHGSVMEQEYFEMKNVIYQGWVHKHSAVMKAKVWRKRWLVLTKQGEMWDMAGECDVSKKKPKMVNKVSFWKTFVRRNCLEVGFKKPFVMYTETSGDFTRLLEKLKESGCKYDENPYLSNMKVEIEKISPSKWSEKHVFQWLSFIPHSALETFGSSYGECFGDCDGRDLLNMKDISLKKMGIVKLVHRKALLRSIRRLRNAKRCNLGFHVVSKKILSMMESRGGRVSLSQRNALSMNLSDPDAMMESYLTFESLVNLLERRKAFYKEFQKQGKKKKKKKKEEIIMDDDIEVEEGGEDREESRVVNFAEELDDYVEGEMGVKFQEGYHRRRETELKGTVKKNTNFPLKIVITEIVQSNRHKSVRKLLSPILSRTAKYGSEFGLFHTSVIIGQWYLEWNNSSLCIPRRCSSGSAIMSIDLPLPLHHDFGNDAELITRRIANLVCHWNTRKRYHQTKRHSETGNCQDFVVDVLTLLNMKTEYGGALGEFLKRMRVNGTCDPIFYVSETLQKEIGIKEKKVKFKSHAQLDAFVYYVYQKMFDFPQIYVPEYSLLKSFDRAFWLRHFKFPDDSRYKPLTVEKACEITGDHEDSNRFGLFEYKTGCPFHDPRKTMSIVGGRNPLYED